jgi:hypothetical protein
VQCPCPVGVVRDLRRSILAIAGGRPRTKANETEMETTPASFPAVTHPPRGPLDHPGPSTRTWSFAAGPTESGGVPLVT